MPKSVWKTLVEQVIWILIPIPEPIKDQDIYNSVVNIKTGQIHLKHAFLIIMTYFTRIALALHSDLYQFLP